MFYTFIQNNTRGVMEVDPASGISEYVIIEASSADDANKRAVDIGIYFYGVKEGKDCACCGDRWHKTNEQCGTTSPSVWGDDVIAEDRSLRIQPFERGFIHYL